LFVKVKYTGKKDYNKTFKNSGTRYADKSKTYTVKDLVPGTLYTFQVYGTSKCGNSTPVSYTVETKISGKRVKFKFVVLNKHASFLFLHVKCGPREVSEKEQLVR